MVLIGLDGGGSTLRGAASTGERAEAGPANWSTTPRAELLASLASVLTALPPAQAVAGCLAGILTDAQAREAEAAIALHQPSARVRVWPDWMAVLAGAPEGTDLCMIAGTGCVVVSAADLASPRKSGGGGWMLGDHGSAAHAGREALWQAFFARPEASPGPALVALLHALLGTAEPAGVIAALHADPTPARQLARLAPGLGEDAAAGVPSARAALARLAGAQAELLRSHPADPAPRRVFLTGGLWKAHSAFRQALEEQLPPNWTLVQGEAAPLDGALRLAARILE